MFVKILAVLVAFVVAAVLAGQDRPKIKRVPPTATSPASGQEMFVTYCAVCHGKDGKGDGPAVPALKTLPPDLTRLSATNSGQFPELRIYTAIRGDSDQAAHGSKDMPVWGSVFRSMGRDDGGVAQMRMSNLTMYIKSIQK